MKIICSKKSFIYCNFPKVEKCADKNLPEKVKNLLSEIERHEPCWRARGIAAPEAQPPSLNELNAQALTHLHS